MTATTLAKLNEILPSVEEFRARSRGAALLEAIVCPEWQYRYFSYNCAWAPGEQLGSLRNGSGAHHFALFTNDGCFLKGFDPESPRDPHIQMRMIEGVDASLAHALTEPAFDMKNLTYCFWRNRTDLQWRTGFPDVSTSAQASIGYLPLLSTPQLFVDWVADYHEVLLPASVVARVFANEPLSIDLLELFPGDRSIEGLDDDVNEIGYPTSYGD